MIARISILLLSLFLLCTCNKSGGNNIAPATFSFKGNNSAHSWNGTLWQDSVGVGIIQVIRFGQSRITLHARKEASSLDNRVWLDITLDSALQVKEYVYRAHPNQTPLATRFTFGLEETSDQRDFVNGLEGDSVRIQITSIRDSLVSGNFTALLTVVGDISKKMRITEGSFQNTRLVKILQ